MSFNWMAMYGKEKKMIYVDPLVNNLWRYGPNCHLFTDGNMIEFHKFAGQLGLKRMWYQTKRINFLHYDLTANKRKKAIALGAIEVDRKFAVEFMRGKK